MFRNILLATLFLFCGTALAANDPTLHQVYQATQAGRLDEAQQMMNQVLKDHPDSAKAHYVEAEILVRQGRRSDAASELQTAQRLSPGLSFASPEAVSTLRAAIDGQGGPVQKRQGFPWGMLFLGIGAIFVIYFLFRSFAGRSRYVQAQPYGGQPGFGPGYGQGCGPGYGPVGGGGGMGSGILSGLATGAAVGAGMVAGEEIAHHLMGGGNQTPDSNMTAASDSWSSNQDFGVADNSSWDDGSSFADNSDFGGGGDWT